MFLMTRVWRTLLTNSKPASRRHLPAVPAAGLNGIFGPQRIDPSVQLSSNTGIKNPVRETLNLLTCAVRSIDTILSKKIMKQIMCNVSVVRCQVSHVMCHVSRATCHMSLTPTATDTYPSPANSPTMHSRMVQKVQKIKLFFCWIILDYY